jgi:hypothetical protein
MSMPSEWLKVMLEEIARKRDEQERARAERDERERERAGQPPSGQGMRHR